MRRRSDKFTPAGIVGWLSQNLRTNIGDENSAGPGGGSGGGSPFGYLHDFRPGQSLAALLLSQFYDASPTNAQRYYRLSQ